MVHHLLEHGAVAAVVADVGMLEGGRRATARDGARDERVAGARRDAQVVLEHVPLPVAPAHQIDARDVAVDVLRRREPVALRKPPGAGEHEVLGDDAVGDDGALAVHVGQKRVERADALRKADRKLLPFCSRYGARYGVEGEETLVERAVFVQAELHAPSGEFLVDARGVRNQIVHTRPPAMLVRIGRCGKARGRLFRFSHLQARSLQSGFGVVTVVRRAGFRYVARAVRGAAVREASLGGEGKQGKVLLSR